MLQNQLRVRTFRAATSDEMDRGIDLSKQFKTVFIDIAFQLKASFYWINTETREQRKIVRLYHRGGVFFCFRPMKGGTSRSQ